VIPPRNKPPIGWTKRRLIAVAVAVTLASLLLVPARAVLGAPSVSVGWSRAGGATGPSPRLHAAIAFDPQAGTTLLFGGRSGSQILGDTWTWDGTAWTLRTPAASPPPLESASTAYDDTTHQVLLFGGLTAGGGPSGATWSWDGTTWTELTPSSSPTPRFSASMAENSATHTLVLFGGFAMPGVPFGDTWTWDGNNWTQASPPSSPAARGGAGTASGPTGLGVVIFGGSTGSQALADTWTWDGTTWTQRNPSNAPSPRVDAAMAPEAGVRATLLFGGSPGSGSPLTDTWTWDGTTWSQPALAASRPAGRSGAALGPGRGGQANVLFGGVTSGGRPSGDTWTFGPVVDNQGQSSTTTVPPSITSPRTSRPPQTTVRPGTSRSSSSASTTGQARPKPQLLGVTAHSVHDGDTVTLSGGGFAPRSTIVLSFHSTPIVVGAAVADQLGRFSVTVAVPAHAPPGQHHFEASGPTLAGSERILDAAVGVTVPHRGTSWVLPAVMVLLTVLLAAGAAVALTRVGNWTQGPAT
jgi:hypothetical protein